MKPKLATLMAGARRRGSRTALSPRMADLLARMKALPWDRAEVIVASGAGALRRRPLDEGFARLAAQVAEAPEEGSRVLDRLEAALGEVEARWRRRLAGEDPAWTTRLALFRQAKADPKTARAWRLELNAAYDGDPPDMDEIEELHEMEPWLASTQGLGVDEHGLVTFDRRTNAVRRIVQDLPVAVYHHTATRILPAVRRDGLTVARQRKASSHLNSHAGVYVTTEVDGAAVRGYRGNAVAFHGGDGTTLTIRTTLDELDDDPDDQDLAWAVGRQFVLPYVPPDDIVDWGER